MEAKQQRNDKTIINILRFWIAYPLFAISGIIGGPLFRRLVIESFTEASK